ncbi:MAG: sigma-54 dependent transcriptional regulator [Bacteroidetes bacterium]|nr:sigma-54 dependent transcriptional regulator [Bacteroidota bacterium]
MLVFYTGFIPHKPCIFVFVHTVLIIDDEEKLLSLLVKIVRLEGYEVLEAPDGKTALKKLELTAVAVVLCDVKLPDENGVDLCKKIKDKYPSTEVILMTAYGNIPDGVQAIKNGAFDYIVKGDDNNKIIPLLARAMEKVQLAHRVTQLEKQLQHKYSFENIIGSSKAIRQAVELAQKVSDTHTTVLLTGETGTGKEVFAQAIHQSSRRNKHAFVAINCAAFSKDLLDNELFGHKAGAFTGASRDQKGLFDEAHQGTLFLDEIGEMPLELQAKLLRVLENGSFIRIGESKPTQVDVRIIAATNRDLNAEIAAGNFREDLFYRISVFEIQLPSLRDRVADIEQLARYFVLQYAARTNKKIQNVSHAYLERLKMHAWKGNIRELKNIIERSIILSNTDPLEVYTLPMELQYSGGVPDVNHAMELASVEKQHIIKVLQHTRGNKTEAARLLDIALTTLYRKLEAYHIA